MLAKTLSDIRSAINWNGLRFISSARSRTMIGGFMAISGASAGTSYFGLLGALAGAGAPVLASLSLAGFLAGFSFFFLRSRTAGRTGILPSSMKPTFLPRSLGSSASSSCSSGSSAVSSTVSSSASPSVSSSSTSSGFSAGAVMITGSGATGVSSRVGSVSGVPAICSSRYSAVILSRVLEATFALVIPNSLALARTSLLGIPAFLAIS